LNVLLALRPTLNPLSTLPARAKILRQHVVCLASRFGAACPSAVDMLCPSTYETSAAIFPPKHSLLPAKKFFASRSLKHMKTFHLDLWIFENL